MNCTIKTIFIDRKYRLLRIWSNRELQKFSHLFTGDIVNVSGWTDLDKEEKHYRDYFVNAKSYTITNYKAEARGIQGYKNEIYLDLENELPKELINRFDGVFNHTVLEHIFEIHTAFKNLCLLSKDIVIIVVPFLQQMHSNYGDYWRFTPLTIKRMFENQGMSLLYLSFNSDQNASVYIFAIATKNLLQWQDKIFTEFSYLENKQPLDRYESYIVCHAIQNNLYVLRLYWEETVNYILNPVLKLIKRIKKFKKSINTIQIKNSKTKKIIFSVMNFCET